MAARKSATRSVKKGAKKRKKRSARKRQRDLTVVIDASAELSPYGKVVLRAFDAGVQKAYKRMSAAGIAATVVIDGKVIRAIPHREGGRFVVREPEMPVRTLRRHRR